MALLYRELDRKILTIPEQKIFTFNILTASIAYAVLGIGVTNKT
jgi:hypothetical protein